MIRALSGPERIWLHADPEGAPFALSILVPGEGDWAGLGQALATAAQANPGARATLKRGLWSPRWVAGPVPTLHSLDTAPTPGRVDWLPDAPFQLAVAPGPTLVFTAHHALMDGRGLWHMVQEVFRAWRGEPLLGAQDDLDDRTLIRPGLALPEPGRFPAPTGAFGSSERPIWAHRFLPGPQSSLLPRLALALVDHSRGQNGAVPLRFDVPVDLRSGQQSTANLTGIASLDVAPGDTLQQVQTALKRVLDQDQAHAWLAKAQEVRWVPHWAMPRLVRSKTQADLRSGRFPNSGVLSNLGRVALESLRAPGFEPQTCYWVPPCGPNTTAFVGLMGDGHGLHISVVMPEGLGDQGRLEALMDSLATALS